MGKAQVGGVDGRTVNPTWPGIARWRKRPAKALKVQPRHRCRQPLVAGAVSAFGRRAQRAAVEDHCSKGSGVRLGANDSKALRSWTIASKAPAAIHLLVCW
jgi:hypothetical protein